MCATEEENVKKTNEKLAAFYFYFTYDILAFSWVCICVQTPRGMDNAGIIEQK